MAKVHGTCDEAFEPVKQALQANLDNNQEVGAAIHVDIGGRSVIDIWGGYTDRKKSQLWEKDTIVNVWSTTKNVTSLAALILVERGLLDVDAKVSQYWPEFAANGKENITVRHILSHSSGVSGWEAPFEEKDLYDLEKSTAHLAAQAPWWEPGSQSGYHATNYGHLVGELVYRITGKHLRDFINEEIVRPTGADFQLGARESDWSRIAETLPPPPFDPTMFSKLDPNSPAIKTYTVPPPNALKANTPEYRRAEIGGINGHTNARALARIFSLLALGGEKDGVRLLSQETINRILDVQFDGFDLVILSPVRWGLGYGLSHADTTPWIPQDQVFFWPGWGGSILLVDLKNKMTITYVMNKMGPGILGSDRTRQYVDAIYDVVNKSQIA
ncbi:hypothetical protein PISL3812_07007 [Talaromyces islandicus]|uniref:Beta-lactamase-related domain-containing protein n=1 Tax=Talaromyces islandicus TaxID=28573 RepID=A0A0U1M323_TALIS|nr:hypothetical protein PISL3812_07007 [Talaromyces islandicus]